MNIKWKSLLILLVSAANVVVSEAEVGMQVVPAEHRLGTISAMDASGLRHAHMELSRELHMGFRDWALSFPPLPVAELELMRADFIEVNLELYVERDLLRQRMARMGVAEMAPPLSAAEAATARSRLQKQIADTRAANATGHPSPKTP